MKVILITSCTGQKAGDLPEQIALQSFGAACASWSDFRAHQPTNRQKPAELLYTGQQHRRLMRGVRCLREKYGTEAVEVWIVSAGYGLVPGNREIAPYDATFRRLTQPQLHRRALELGIPGAARSLLSRPSDLALVLLGQAYLEALELDDTLQLGGPTLFISARSCIHLVHGLGPKAILPLGKAEAKRFHCGLVGLKGEVASRLLCRLAREGERFLLTITQQDSDILSLLDGS